MTKRSDVNENYDEDKVMSISSINSSGSMALSGMKNMQRPDASKMAEDLFSKLDSSGKGYIEKSDLASALSQVSGSSSSNATSADDMFSKLDSDGDGKVTKAEMSATLEKMASELDGPFPRMRLQEGQSGQGEMPPPPPPQDGSQSASSTDSSSSSQNSDPADTNGDGTVSAEEALAYAEKQLSTANDTASTANADAQLMQMLGSMQPPPPPTGDNQDDQGFTKDQLTAMSKELSSTDSQRSQVMNDIANNFDAADINGDGKVTASEARAFEESKNSSGSDSATNTSSSSTSNTSDAQFLKQMMDLLHAYSGFDQSTESSGFSTSA